MTERRTILIVEDSPTVAMTCQVQLEPLGHDLLLAADGRTARELLETRKIDCVLLDLKLPDIDGLELLDELRTWPAPPAVVVMTSNASLATAVRAVRAGAFDYLVKPFGASRLATTVTNALSINALSREVATLRRTVEPAEFGRFIGRSLPMQAVYRILEAAAQSSASVFITGESGTGKELAAEALHQMGPRRDRRFVALNCGAIPRDLLESTIFGHVKGAFSGAVSDQEGAAARADGGTLFLDELGEMDPQLQTKLLRFIQTGSYDRVGDPRPHKVNIRFVAATNRDPAQAIAEMRLREDLFYRLNVVPVHMPPLRERGEDIVLIARRMLADFAKPEGRHFTAFAPEVEARLLGYAWPGNVRQLENVIRNIVVLHDAPVVQLEMLPPLPADRPGPAPAPAEPAPAPPAAPVNPPIGLPASVDAIDTLARAEQRYIEHAIALCEGNLQLAARRLGISPSTIYRKRESWERGSG